MPFESIFRHLGIAPDPGAWIVPGQLLLRSYPRRVDTLRELASRGVTVLVNLDRRPHNRANLDRFGLTEIHIPVPDFTAPTPEDLDRGIDAIETHLLQGHVVAVHCAAGLGRSGTLIACYLVQQGQAPQGAIAQVRKVRPGAIETDSQVAAVETYARDNQTSGRRPSEASPQ
jgi:atypical dual specificity phosphatase